MAGLIYQEVQFDVCFSFLSRIDQRVRLCHSFGALPYRLAVDSRCTQCGQPRRLALQTAAKLEIVVSNTRLVSEQRCQRLQQG